ncbi:MAG: Fe-S-containing protein [Bacteroidota bacterium]
MICSQCGAQVSDAQKFCTNCGNPISASINENKVAAPKKSSATSKIILISVLVAGLVYYGLTLTRNYHPVISDQPSVGYGTNPGQGQIKSFKTNAQIDGNDIIIDVETVTKHGIIRFNDPEGKQTVPVIAYISPRGKIVTAMSISESCRSDDFYLEGKTIHCASCPSYWDMESLEAYACCQKYYPDPIPSRVERGVLKISKNVVQEWRTRL